MTMFDTKTLDPMTLGRFTKHMNTPVKYERAYMTRADMYTQLAPVTKIRYRKVAGPEKTGYGLADSTGAFLDCPKIVWQCCTLPEES